MFSVYVNNPLAPGFPYFHTLPVRPPRVTSTVRGTILYPDPSLQSICVGPIHRVICGFQIKSVHDQTCLGSKRRVGDSEGGKTRETAHGGDGPGLQGSRTDGVGSSPGSGGVIPLGPTRGAAVTEPRRRTFVRSWRPNTTSACPPSGEVGEGLCDSSRRRPWSLDTTTTPGAGGPPEVTFVA